MVLDSVAARTSKLAYGSAIDQIFAIAGSRPLTRAVVMEFRAPWRVWHPQPRTSGCQLCASWSGKPAATGS